LVDISFTLAQPQWVMPGKEIELIEEPQSGTYDAVVLAVAHRQFHGTGARKRSLSYAKPPMSSMT